MARVVGKGGKRAEEREEESERDQVRVGRGEERNSSPGNPKKEGKRREEGEKKGEERQRKRNKGERKQNRVTRKREREGKGKEKRRKENQDGRRSSPREVILQVYGVHVCSGSAYASAGRQGSWLERKGKKETLSPGQKPSRLTATKSGSVPEGREETALPQVRWVGTAARVPGWKSCKGQGGRDP